jgi:hypothetical protein
VKLYVFMQRRRLAATLGVGCGLGLGDDDDDDDDTRRRQQCSLVARSRRQQVLTLRRR